MGLTYPTRDGYTDWRPPSYPGDECDGNQQCLHVAVKDAYDALIESHWVAWTVAHARGTKVDGQRQPNMLYAHVLAAVIGHAVDLHETYYAGDGRPCARVYSASAAQIVDTLARSGIAVTQADVRNALRWLLGYRKVPSPTTGRRTQRIAAPEYPMIKILDGNADEDGGSRQAPLYMLALPAGMVDRGMQSPVTRDEDEAEAPATPTPSLPDPTLRGPAVGQSMLHAIVQHHVSAGNSVARDKPYVITDTEVARVETACMRLLAQGYTWRDLSRAHAAYINDWRANDHTPTGRLLKGLGSYFQGTTKAGRTDSRWGVMRYLRDAQRYPELLGERADGSGWRIFVDDDGTCHASYFVDAGRGIVGHDLDATTMDDAITELAAWYYSPASQEARDHIEAVEGTRIEVQETGDDLPADVNLRAVMGDWEWCWVGDLGTPYECWHAIPDARSETDARMRLRAWLDSDAGRKDRAAARKRQMVAAVRKEPQGQQDVSSSQADDSSGAPQDGDSPASRTAAPSAPDPDPDWGAKVAAMAPYDDTVEDIPF